MVPTVVTPLTGVTLYSFFKTAGPNALYAETTYFMKGTPNEVLVVVVNATTILVGEILDVASNVHGILYDVNFQKYIF